MSMRCVYLIPKIYGHRLETLCSENSMAAHREEFFEMYETLKEREFALYYEYNYPTQGYFTAVLAAQERAATAEPDGRSVPSKSDTSFLNPRTPVETSRGSVCDAAAEILNAEFIKEAFRLINDLVSREMRSSLGRIEYPAAEKKEALLKALYERWDKLPAPLPGKEETLLCPAPILFQCTLGLRLGCSGGGSCASCTHPTCGYRSS